MRRREDHADAPGARSPGAGATFQALTRALTEQLEAARRGRLEEVETLAGQVDALLAKARRAGAALREADRRRLRNLHEKVRLALAQQQAELADRRAHLRRGKGTVRAYAASSGSEDG